MTTTAKTMNGPFHEPDNNADRPETAPVTPLNLEAIPREVLEAVGLNPDLLSNIAKPAAQMTTDSTCDHDITDNEWRALEALCATWRVNAIRHRSHRETISNALWLTARRLGWNYLPPERDNAAAHRLRCFAWARGGRWHAILATVEAQGSGWPAGRIELVRSIAKWSERVCARIDAKRAKVRSMRG
jgi:hypothetical protein